MINEEVFNEIFLSILCNNYNQIKTLNVKKNKKAILFKKYFLVIIENIYFEEIDFEKTIYYEDFKNIAYFLNLNEKQFNDQIKKYNGYINKKGFIYFKKEKYIDNFIEYIESIIIINKINN